MCLKIWSLSSSQECSRSRFKGVVFHFHFLGLAEECLSRCSGEVCYARTREPRFSFNQKKKVYCFCIWIVDSNRISCSLILFFFSLFSFANGRCLHFLLSLFQRRGADSGTKARELPQSNNRVRSQAPVPKKKNENGKSTRYEEPATFSVVLSSPVPFL